MIIQFKTRGIKEGLIYERRAIAVELSLDVTDKEFVHHSIEAVCRMLLDYYPNVWEVRWNEINSEQGHYFSNWDRYQALLKEVENEKENNSCS